MTIQEAIEKVDEQQPNGFSVEAKVSWLSNLDGKIMNDLILTHENNEVGNWHPYKNGETDHVLIAPAPFDEMYTTYLCMRINEANGETARYNNSASLFNEMYQDYAKDYNRKHKPISKQRLHIFN